MFDENAINIVYEAATNVNFPYLTRQRRLRIFDGNFQIKVSLFSRRKTAPPPLSELQTFAINQ
jgi:hypothetical protein